MKTILIAMFCAMAACGSGGGSDGGAAAPEGTFTVSGTALYEKKAVDAATATLTETISLVGIPTARVEVVDTSSGTVVAQGATDLGGGFVIPVPNSRLNATLIVKILTESRLDHANVLVTNHSLTTYSISSPLFTGARGGLVFVASADTSTGRFAGAFNIYSQLLAGINFAKAFEPSLQFPPLWAHWTAGDNDGCTCASHLPVANGIVYTIGIQDSADDTNDFDDSVILHELGHYMHSAFSHDSSPGGRHYWSSSTPQDLDYRLAFSEGWATAFGQRVLGQPVYLDTRSTGGTRVDLESAATNVVGPGSEVAVASVLWDLLDGPGTIIPSSDGDTLGLGFARVWQAMRDLQGQRHVTLANFLGALLDRSSITSAQWNYNFASWGMRTPLPAFPAYALAINTTYTHQVDASLGQETLMRASQFYQVTIPSNGTLTATFTIADALTNNLDLLLWENPAHPQAETLGSSNSTSASVERVTVSIQAGTYLLQVRAQSDPVGSSAADFWIRLDFSPGP